MTTACFSLRTFIALVTVIGTGLGTRAADDESPPWKTNSPIVTVKKELYRKYPKPGAAAMVGVVYVGPKLERQEIHSLEIRDDVPEDSGRRVSLDNGRTWSKFEPLPKTLSYPNKIEVWEGGGAVQYDPASNLLVGVWLRQINRGGLYHNFTYTRVSPDMGRTWTEPVQLKYEEGDAFDPADPVKPSFLEKNNAYYGSNILPLRNGTLLHVVAHANVQDDPQNDRRPWRMGAVCFIGTWDAVAHVHHWTAGGRLAISPEKSSRGLMEPAAAELSDGRVLVIFRGSNTKTTPGRKWFSVSRDGGKTFSPVEELKYDDGTSFYSPSSYHALIRHSLTGKLYWVGNICAAPPHGNSPRYPLVICEVDENIPALRKKTVTVIDDRVAGQGNVQFSNFSLIEDRESHVLEMYLTAYSEDPANANNANCYKYTAVVADPAAHVLFTETFGDKLDKDWSWVREEPKAWKLENNSLVLRTQRGYLHAHYNDAKNVLVRPVPDSGGSPIAIEVEMENDPKIQFEHAGILWYYDDDNYASLFKESLDGNPEMQMVMEKDAKPTFARKKCSSKKVWIRLLIAEGKVTSQFRESEKEEWTTVGEKPLPRTGPAKAGVMSGGAPKDGDRSVTFRTFRIVQLGK